MVFSIGYWICFVYMKDTFIWINTSNIKITTIQVVYISEENFGPVHGFVLMISYFCRYYSYTTFNFFSCIFYINELIYIDFQLKTHKTIIIIRQYVKKKLLIQILFVPCQRIIMQCYAYCVEKQSSIHVLQYPTANWKDSRNAYDEYTILFILFES